MVQASFSDKLKVLVDVSSSSGICIASIFLLIFVGALFITTNKKNAKNSKKLYLSIYVLLIVIMLIKYYSSLTNMWEYMMNNFFIGFYFPNLAIYLAAIILTNIILWNTIFNFKEDKLLKYVNTTVYCMIHYLLILILNVVSTNKLDVFDQSSIYKNTDASALISLSSTIFIIWICFMIVYKIIRKTQKKNEKVRIPVRRIIRYKKKMPANYASIKLPSTLVGKAGRIRPAAAYVQPDLLEFYKQPEEVKQDESLKEYESMFTLEDYKKMIEILKSGKEETKVTINDDFNEEITEEDSKVEIKESNIQEQLSLELEKELNEPEMEESNNNKIEIVQVEEEEVPQPKLEELLNLYRSV